MVDAARTGAAPGTLHLWTEGLPTTSSRPSAGSHALGIAYALALGQALHRVPQRLAVIGIEAGELDPGETLSADVAAAVDRAVELVARLVVGRVVAEGPDYPGRDDVARAASQLSARLPTALSGLGSVAFNYLWSWTRSGGEVFSLIDPIRWDRCHHNPVRLLLEASDEYVGPSRQRRRAGRSGRSALPRCCRRDFPASPHFGSWAHPVAFLCAEFGIHGSLPIYSGRPRRPRRRHPEGSL